MDFRKLTKIEIKEIKKESIIAYREIRELCKRKYPNHKKGCPNVDICKSLNIPYFNDIKDNYSYFYLIYIEFNFRLYKQLRSIEKPEWTEKQCSCCLYWQSSLKKLLSESINLLNLNNQQHYLLGCGSKLKVDFQNVVGSMENSCINVFSTCKLNNIKLKINPKNKIILVNLICSKKKLSVFFK